MNLELCHIDRVSIKIDDPFHQGSYPSNIYSPPPPPNPEHCLFHTCLLYYKWSSDEILQSYLPPNLTLKFENYSYNYAHNK